MASITIGVGGAFTDGSTVGAYPASAWSGQYAEGTPKGSATDTDTVTNQSVTFTGLANSTTYYCTDATGTRYLTVTTAPAAAAGGSDVASGIEFTPAGTVAATNVQDALEEVASEAESVAASAVTFTPAGTLAATDVQAAIVEAAAEAGSGSSSTLAEFTLDGATSIGATTITLNKSPGNLGKGNGYVVVDPFTTSCDIRQVASVSTNTLTLTPNKNTSISNVQFHSGTKQIRLGRNITSISGDGATVTVITDAAHGLSTSATVQIAGTVAYNTLGVGAKTITVTDSTTFTYAATTTGSESTGCAIPSAQLYEGGKFMPGQKVKVTGSASNNATFTVTANGTLADGHSIITVSESVTSEIVSGSVTFRIDLNHAHSSGAPVYWMEDNNVPAVWYGVKADAATGSASQNTAGLQAAMDDMYYQSLTNLILPGVTIYVNATLRPDMHMHLIGSDPVKTAIVANGMTFSTDDDAIISARKDGRRISYVNAATTGRYAGSTPLTRLNLTNLEVNGANISGANGILFTFQQPNLWDNVRAKNCPGYGIAAPNGQQLSIRNLMVSSNGVNIKLKFVKFLWFTDLNTEDTTAHILVEDSYVSGDHTTNLVFDRVHVEDTGNTSIMFDINDSIGLHIKDAYASMSGGSTFFKLAANAGSPVLPGTYTIDNFRAAGGNPDTATIIDDTDRGISLIGSDVGREIRSLVADIHGGYVLTGGGDAGEIVINGDPLDLTADGGSAAAVLAKSHRPTGALLETVPRYLRGGAGSTAPTSGTLVVAMLPEPLYDTETYSSATFQAGSTALSGGTHQWAVLVKASDLSVLAVSADATSAAWSANATKTFSFTTPYTASGDTKAYVGLLIAASTVPTIQAIQSIPTAITGLAPILTATSGTSLTTPPAVSDNIAALTVYAHFYYAYLS